MNDPDDKLDRLFAAARAAKPDTARAEYGFETRLLARIREDREREVSWFGCVWRLTPAFAAVVLALAAWDLARPADAAPDLALAIVGGAHETGLIAYLTGD